MSALLCDKQVTAAQVEWRLLVVDALDGDIEAAESRGLAGARLQEALEVEDGDGDGFITVEEVFRSKIKEFGNASVHVIHYAFTLLL